MVKCCKVFSNGKETTWVPYCGVARFIFQNDACLCFLLFHLLEKYCKDISKVLYDFHANKASDTPKIQQKNNREHCIPSYCARMQINLLFPIMTQFPKHCLLDRMYGKALIHTLVFITLNLPSRTYFLRSYFALSKHRTSKNRNFIINIKSIQPIFATKRAPKCTE